MPVDDDSDECGLDVGDAIRDLGRSESIGFGVDDFDRVPATSNEGSDQPCPDGILDGGEPLPK
jgi:hypothetical protein